jgi:hypothetical protein
MNDKLRLILIHGAGLGSWIWERVLPHLDTRVYAICRAAGYEPPFVFTPFELMEGQQ